METDHKTDFHAHFSRREGIAQGGKMYILKVTTDGKVFSMKMGHDLLKMAQEAAGGYIEIVHPINLPRPFCMIVDDEGRLKQKPFNEIASILYGYPAACSHPIVGNVILVKEVELPDGKRDIGGLSDEDVNTVIGIIATERQNWQAELLKSVRETIPCRT